ncbi:MAG: Gfo/Idh/MocA family protein [Acidobacteriota bacterium]
MRHKQNPTRRDFLQTAVATSAAAAVVTRSSEVLASAPNGPVLKVGLIGCGGRGTGAAHDILAGAENIKITALGDLFRDRVDRARTALSSKGQTVAEDRCFTGFDNFEKVLASDIDLVILATPPHFRPQHFAASVAAKKHVFIEKPVAVDPSGIRSVLHTGEKAQAAGLSVVAGTQRRHQSSYLAVYKQIAAGAIGEIVGANCYWNMGKLWHRDREAGWSDMEWAIRNWVNWTWLSGDHIVEQHVHNLDVVEWFTGSHPVKAVGMGGRHRRITGDQYDTFSVDYEFANGMHLHSMCRQIDGCANSVSEFFTGTKGSALCYNNGRITIFGKDGKTVVWKFTGTDNKPYQQEHTDLVAAIRTGKQINETRNVAESCLTAIMGRISAYTGQALTRDEALKMEMRLGPTAYDLMAAAPEVNVAVPGVLSTRARS